MKKVAVLLAPGFEEAEALLLLILCDVCISTSKRWRVLNHGRW